MAYNYNKYQEEYRKKHLVLVTVRLNKEKDKDIVELVENTNNKNETLKKMIRIGMGKISLENKEE